MVAAYRRTCSLYCALLRLAPSDLDVAIAVLPIQGFSELLHG